MDYGLYSIFLGMRARQNTLEAQSNNIANSSSTGFKAERLLYSSMEPDAKQQNGDSRQKLASDVMTSGTADFSPGSIEQTGRTLDVAIQGDAFLQVQTSRGVRFTRAGNLSLSPNGQLITKNGDLVVGSNGPITIPEDAKITIAADGSIASGDQVMDELKLVRFNNPSAALLKEGDSVFMLSGSEVPQKNATSTVLQGSLENSNVNSITEMVAMINNNREFESLQKSLTLLMNDLGKKISGEIGRIS